MPTKPIFERDFFFGWQNIGICFAYGILFVAMLLVFTEFNTGTAGLTAVTIFKRGTSKSVVRDSGSPTNEDDEKALHVIVSDEKPRPEAELESDRALAEHPKMTDIFSWQNIKYIVPISGGEHRQLLEDVTGYVSPGKLTALMGESGAGKVSALCLSYQLLILPVEF